MDFSLTGGNGMCLKALRQGGFKASDPAVTLPEMVRERPGGTTALK